MGFNKAEMYEGMVWDIMKEIKIIIERLENEVLFQVSSKSSGYIDNDRQLGFLNGLAKAIEIIKDMDINAFKEV